MRIVLVTAAVVGLLAGGVAVWWWTSGPNMSELASLREPRLTSLGDQRMLVVEVTGDPNVVAGPAFKQLFERYYGLAGVSRMARPPAPRARWPLPLGTQKNQWVGRYALPVPPSAAVSLAESSDGTGMAINTWTYGEVAEILHVGSYSTEGPDIERLNAFVGSHGYRVVGEHEEEYVKGPGMIFAGNPDTYLTIIRLRVARSSNAGS